MTSTNRKAKPLFLLLFMALASLMVQAMIPLPGLADEGTQGKSLQAGQQPSTTILREATVSVSGEGAWDNDALLDAYVCNLFDETIPGNDGAALETQSGADNLSGDALNVYRYLKSQIKLVASGELKSTEFRIPGDCFESGLRWTAQDLGVDAIYENGAINEEAENKMYAEIFPSINPIYIALLTDCPCDLYWFDKTSENAFFCYTSINSSDMVTFEIEVYIRMAPASAYGDAETWTVYSDQVTRAQTAVANASAIALAHKDKAALTRLTCYATEILNLVSYDSEAMADASIPYGDPWQLVSVFDDDPTTNVVCEGYSKAFKYLCDASGCTDVETLLVWGESTDGTDGGQHMWNVVKMDDGKSYLADVTNSADDMIGSYGQLFIAAPDSGSYAEGYTFTIDDEPTPHAVTYVYDSRLGSTLGEEDLTLATESYVPIGIELDAQLATATYNGKPHEPGVSITYDGTALTRDVDYSVTYENNTNAGQASVTATGINNFAGRFTKSATFTIEPFDLEEGGSIEKPATVVYSGSAQKPTPVVKATLDGAATATTLGAGDFDVAYANNVNAGTATATVTGKGNFTGSLSTTFKINAASLAKAKITLKKATVTFNNKAQAPAVKTAKLGSKSLKAGTDYTVKYLNAKGTAIGSKAVKNAGKYQVQIVGKGNYKGTAKATYTIAKATNPLRITKATRTLKLAKVKKAKQTVAGAVVKKKGIGTVTYSKVKVNKNGGKFTVNKKTGKITVAKGTPKGVYAVTVKAVAKGNANYKASGSKKAVVTIRVA